MMPFLQEISYTLKVIMCRNIIIFWHVWVYCTSTYICEGNTRLTQPMIKYSFENFVSYSIWTMLLLIYTKIQHN